jgi:glucose/arabinose dehydrogenase
MRSTASNATRCLVTGARSNPGVAACLLLSVLGTAACSDSKNPGPDGASGDTTGNAAGGNGQGGSSGNGTGGGVNEGGSAGIGLNQGGSGAGGLIPDPAKDCGDAANAALPELKLTPFLSGFTRPILLTQPRGETDRLFVVEKPGTIRIVRGGQVLATPFLDIEEAVSERYEEMGLLGLAFHPSFAENGRFYLYYSTLVNGDEHRSRIVEYGVSSANPDLVDAGSARVLLEVGEPQDNHNGGHLAFGSDGFLYIGLGDGGGQADQHGATGNGQNLGTHLGKLLRIDVNGRGAGPNQAYAIPAGNMTTNGALPEIWSYGLRNPWRYSFDACTGDLYIGDVGQEALEEVDFEPAQSGGHNYGWRLMEAEDCFNPGSGCNPSSQNLTLPVASYDHDVGQSITGGYVYRGHAIPNLRGTYLYADYSTARFFALRMRNGAPSLQQTEITDNINPDRDANRIGSFGQDEAGELYVLSFGGEIFRIDAE